MTIQDKSLASHTSAQFQCLSRSLSLMHAQHKTNTHKSLNANQPPRRYLSGACNGSTTEDVTTCIPCTTRCREGTRLVGTCSGEGFLDDVTCMVLANTPVSSFFVNASVWFNMTASSFGRTAQDSFRAAVLAALGVAPLEVVLTATEQRMPGIRPRALQPRLGHGSMEVTHPEALHQSKEFHQSQILDQTEVFHQTEVLQPVLRVDSSNSNDAPSLRQHSSDHSGVLVVFTAYFSSQESALKAGSQATASELTRQLIARGLPAPVIVDAPTAFLLEQARVPPVTVTERPPADSVGNNTGLIVGLVVGGFVLALCCGSVLAVYMYARRRKLESMQMHDTEPLQPVSSASVQDSCAVNVYGQEPCLPHTLTNELWAPRICAQEPSSQLWPPHGYTYEPWRLNSDMHDPHAQEPRIINAISTPDSRGIDMQGEDLCTSTGGTVRRQTLHFNCMATLANVQQIPQDQSAQQDAAGRIVLEQERPPVVHVQHDAARHFVSEPEQPAIVHMQPQYAVLGREPKLSGDVLFNVN